MTPLSSIPDPNMVNNNYNYKKAIAFSYDPNIKEVAPSGKGKERFVAKNEPIYFQNTGTAAAKNITITNKIDPNLNINSIHILGASHNANLYKEGNTIKFRFENINLPDSGTNYTGSMGSITYAIKQIKDLAEGSKMQNTAAIYFDYNAPIITNTTLNTIQSATGIETLNLGKDIAVVYPNPSDASLIIKVSNNKEFGVHMIDMMGRLVIVQFTATGELSMNTSSIPNGSY